MMTAETKVTPVPVDVVTRKLIDIAKADTLRNWDMRDTLIRKKVDPNLLGHTTDDIFDLIHELNRVPTEGSGGFIRDDWDNDFIEYFYDDISLDECMDRYSKRLSTLE